MAAAEPFRADLHLHTNASDGALSPEEVMREAAVAGMDVVAVTDHDTVAGTARAVATGTALGMCVLTGIELSVGGDEEIHLIGYGVSPDDGALRAFLDELMEARRERMRTMLERLDEMGMPVLPEEIQAKGGDARFMGRMNLARAMVSRGYVETPSEAFARYLEPGKPAYVPRKRLSVPEGISRLRAFCAVVALAHPGRLRMDRLMFLHRLPGWMEAGLSGIEAYHPSHSAADKLYYDRLAREKGLLVTGGSDFHGRGRDSLRHPLMAPDSPNQRRLRESDGVAIGAHIGGWRTLRDDIQALQWRLQFADHNL